MSRTKARVPLAILVAVLAVGPSALAGGGGGCHKPNTDARGTGVEMLGNCFGPTVLRVGVNETIAWKNTDHIEHTVTSADGAFDARVAPGDTFNFRFTSAGIYPYYCLLHPRMAGAVVVGDATGSQVVANGPQPVAALTERPDEGTSPLSAAIITAFVAAPLSFGAGRILRGRRQAT